MKLCMIQFQWVIDDYDWRPEPVVDAVADFDAVAFSTHQESDHITNKLKLGLEYAKGKGLYTCLWLRTGRWDWWSSDLRAKWPQDWNLRAWVPDIPTCEKYDKDWPDFSKSAVRDWMTAHLVAEVKKYVPYGLDGVLYDYTRFPATAWIVPKQIVSADDVTALVAQTSAEMRAMNLNVLASPIDARMLDIPAGLPAGGKQPRYQVLGQDWPQWIRNGDLDLAYLMTYCGAGSLPEQWTGVPDDVKSETVSLLKMGSGVHSKGDIRDAYRVTTETLGGLTVGAFAPHKTFQETVASGILSTWADLPASPMPEPPDEPDPEPDPPADDDPDVQAIAAEMDGIGRRLVELAGILQS